MENETSTTYETAKEKIGEANGNVPVICRATFKGRMPKGWLYSVLEYIDHMKQRGYVVEKHERTDEEDWVTIDYVLAKHGI